MKIALASDHAGFGKKKIVMKYLSEKGIEFKDFGTYSEDSCDYADYAHPMAEAVVKGECERGISICGSGNGINMVANKHQLIRSALCWMPEIAELARSHNDANVLSMPARYISDEETIAILDKFLNTEFEGGRHLTRINKIPVK